ncbi:MAG TPA: hydrogenase formation protein HypD [Clostridia bacterium]|nr:hydrogenase formation protein HypD [Clostridia bacterium]
MCVAAFGQVVGLNGSNAVVSFGGALKEVSAVLVPKVSTGDTVVVHAGFATEIVKDMQKFYKDVVATDAYAAHLLDAIKKENEKLHGQKFRVMGFCGTHENTIVKYGLRELLPQNIRLISGPGCPVCVTPEEELAMGMELLKRENVILTTYGDLLRVPTPLGSLEQCRARGADIRMIYDIGQALETARTTDREVVHFAVGFETTAPGTAALLKEAGDIGNFSVLSSHRITPPAMEYVLDNSEIDAILCPGHVAMVIGTEPFDNISKKYGIPCVISGFEPTDVLEAILRLLANYGGTDLSIINQYTRVVEDKGNLLAQSLIDEVFTLKDANWRGVGILPKSRLVLKKEYSRFDAESKFGIGLKDNEVAKHDGCICGEVLKGIEPQHCPNFGKACTPSNPKGPCMVSREGTCYIALANN